MGLKMTTEEYYDEFSELWGREYGPLMQTALFAKEPKDFAHVVMGRGIILPGHSVLDVGCGFGVEFGVGGFHGVGRCGEAI